VCVCVSRLTSREHPWWWLVCTDAGSLQLPWLVKAAYLCARFRCSSSLLHVVRHLAVRLMSACVRHVHQVELEDEEANESDEDIPSIATPAAAAAAAAAAATAAVAAAPAAPAAPTPPPPRYRHEWYQTQDKVTVSVFARGVPASDVQVPPAAPLPFDIS
jgi:hypothetical protein